MGRVPGTFRMRHGLVAARRAGERPSRASQPRPRTRCAYRHAYPTGDIGVDDGPGHQLSCPRTLLCRLCRGRRQSADWGRAGRHRQSANLGPVSPASRASERPVGRRRAAPACRRCVAGRATRLGRGDGGARLRRGDERPVADPLVGDDGPCRHGKGDGSCGSVHLRLETGPGGGHAAARRDTLGIALPRDDGRSPVGAPAADGGSGGYRRAAVRGGHPRLSHQSNSVR